MANFTLSLGSIDISPYVRMNPEDGFDPASGDSLAGQFGDTPFGDGQPLLYVQASNKDFVIPVHLKAVDKPTLHALVIQIRDALDTRQQLQWQDVGATSPTFFDVEWGKFVPEYNFRRAGYNYLSGTIHLNVRPYGHTGTTRLVATIAATANNIGRQVTIPVSSIQGDLAPLLEIQAWRTAIPNATASVPTAGEAMDAMLIVSKLPSPSYNAQLKVSAGDLSATGVTNATVISDANAVASKAITLTMTANSSPVAGPFTICNFILSPLSAHGGRNRMFGYVSPKDQLGGGTSQGWSAYVTAANIPSSNLATVVATHIQGADQYYLVDFGTFDVPTLQNVPVPSLAQFTLFGAPACFALGSGVPSGQSWKFAVSEILILPDDGTVVVDTAAYNQWVNGSPKKLILDGVAGRISGIHDGINSFVTGTVTGDQTLPADIGARGDLRSLDLTQVGGGPLIVINANRYPANGGFNQYTAYPYFYTQVKARERFTYAR